MPKYEVITYVAKRFVKFKVGDQVVLISALLDNPMSTLLKKGSHGAIVVDTYDGDQHFKVKTYMVSFSAAICCRCLESSLAKRIQAIFSKRRES